MSKINLKDFKDGLFRINQKFTDQLKMRVAKSLGLNTSLGFMGYSTMTHHRYMETLDPERTKGILELYQPGLADEFNFDLNRFSQALWNKVEGTRTGRVLEPLLYGGGMVGLPDSNKNIVVDEGIAYIMDCALSQGTQIVFTTYGFFCGLTTNYANAAAADDLYADIDTTTPTNAWTEQANIKTDTNRRAFGNVAIAAKVWQNSSMVFTLSADTTTAGGAFIVGGNAANVNVVDDSASTGAILLCVKQNASSNKQGDTDDTITVDYSITGSSS